MQHGSQWQCIQVGGAHKFFVTGVKDLSTGVKYMESPDKAWLHSFLCCQQIHEKLKKTLAKFATFDSVPGRLIIHLW